VLAQKGGENQFVEGERGKVDLGMEKERDQRGLSEHLGNPKGKGSGSGFIRYPSGEVPVGFSMGRERA